MLYRFVIAFLPRSFNFVAAVTIFSDFGAQENKICRCFHFFPHLCAMKWWGQKWYYTYRMHCSVQSLSRVQVFATPWTTAHQASLSITNSWSPPNPCPSSQWCHPTISSSVIPFSSCLLSFPASGSFQMTLQWATSSSHQVAKVLEFQLQHQSLNTQDWSPLGWTDWISLQSKGLSRVFSNTTIQKHQFFSTQLSL